MIIIVRWVPIFLLGLATFLSVICNRYEIDLRTLITLKLNNQLLLLKKS